MKRKDAICRTCSLWLISMVMLCAGCSTPSGDKRPLPPQRLAKLADRARLSGQLGVERREEQGKTVFGNIHAIPIGTQAVASFAPGRRSRQQYIPVVKASLNGRLCRILLDTALPVSLIDYSSALLHKVSPLASPVIGEKEERDRTLSSPQLTHTTMADISQFLAMARSLHMGSLRMYNVPLGIINDTRGLQLLPASRSAHAQVILGHDFLSSFHRITFDFPGHQIRMASRGQHHPAPERLVSAGTFDPSFEQPVMAAMMNGKGPFPVCIATGEDVGLLLPKHIADTLHIPHLAEAKSTHIGTRSRQVSCRNIGPQTLDLSGFEISDVDVLVAETEAQDQPLSYALLGHRALKRFVVTIDYGVRRIYLEQPVKTSR